MLPEYTSDSAGDHVEEPASNKCEQYPQPERGHGIHQVGPDYASDNCHAFDSERPPDRFLTLDSSPQQQQDKR
jgi:hypothetical protein